MILSENSEQKWAISSESVKSLKADILNAVDPNDKSSQILLGLKTRFDRNFPKTAKTAGLN